MNKTSYTIPEINFKSPSFSTLKEFGAKFSKSEWEILCKDKEFVSVILDNIEEASNIAKRILNK